MAIITLQVKLSDDRLSLENGTFERARLYDNFTTSAICIYHASVTTATAGSK